MNKDLLLRRELIELSKVAISAHDLIKEVGIPAGERELLSEKVNKMRWELVRTVAFLAGVRASTPPPQSDT